MKAHNGLPLILVSLLLAAVAVAVPTRPAAAQAPAPPELKLPQAGVPEVFTLEGKFVRAAYNNEGYVILGYQAANRSQGGEWMLLEVGITLLDKAPAFKLMRDAITLETPDGKTIPLASATEQRAGGTQALQKKASLQSDSINYFPRPATQPCRIGFFAELNTPVMPFDEVELSPLRACAGRLYFQIPGGIALGQHWLNVKFQNSVVRVPFRILTKDEEKYLAKNFKDIAQQVDEAFRPKS